MKAGSNHDSVFYIITQASKPAYGIRPRSDLLLLKNNINTCPAAGRAPYETASYSKANADLATSSKPIIFSCSTYTMKRC
jgi:hypothetical protein